MDKNYSKLKKAELVDAIKDHVSLRKDGNQEYLVNKNHGRVDVKSKKIPEMKDKVDTVNSEPVIVVKEGKKKSKVDSDTEEPVKEVKKDKKKKSTKIAKPEPEPEPEQDSEQNSEQDLEPKKKSKKSKKSKVIP
jgi:hypothetical protein